MGNKECGLDRNAPILRAIQHQCGHLSAVWRQSCCTTLSQWRIVWGQMVLNLCDTHLSYVTAYLQTYHCDSCGRHFDQISNWKPHQGGCANATEYEFPGGVHKMTPSMFDCLEEFDIMVLEKEYLYPWFLVYDFEAILSHATEQQATPWLKWLRKHEPVSVSIASNMAGSEEAKCFVNADPEGLINCWFSLQQCRIKMVIFHRGVRSFGDF